MAQCIWTVGAILLTLLSRLVEAHDGCENGESWRCGALCINQRASCNCSGQVFNIRSGRHCCQDSCQGLGYFDPNDKQWEGDQDTSTDFEHVGAKCTGTVLNLTEPCRGVCNHHEGEENRNRNGVDRNHSPCSSNAKTGVTKCILKALDDNGEYDCGNHFDEKPSNKPPTPVIEKFLDLDKVMVPCEGGFKCSGYHGDPTPGCLPWRLWCFAGEPYHCAELNATAVDPRVCSSQSFWEGVPCVLEREQYEDFPSYRCTGGSPGSCWDGTLHQGSIIPSDPGCPDDTHKIEKWEEGKRCALTCAARDGRWKGETICLDEKYICDNTFQCEEGQDEAPVQHSCQTKDVAKKIVSRKDFFEGSPLLSNQSVIERDDLGEKDAGDQFSRSPLTRPAPNSLKWCLPQCKVRQNSKCCYNPTCYQKRKEACQWMGYVTGEEYTY